MFCTLKCKSYLIADHNKLLSEKAPGLYFGALKSGQIRHSLHIEMGQIFKFLNSTVNFFPVKVF